ncbi:MAG TPA: alpha/beta fold hydrolase [Actinoplanes sp.]|nr:alpha/beta fold hydrolase [Actinoplanes sp.]
MSGVLRFDDWISPVPPVEREVLSARPEGRTRRPPVLFVPGPGGRAATFGEHWLEHTASRGFPAYALTPRANGDLRAYAHDVVQVAASLPRQTVLVGHGAGATIVARALSRYPARAAVLVCPMLDRWATIRAMLRLNPLGVLPALARNRLLGIKDTPKPVGDPPVLVAGSPDDKLVSRSSLDRTAARYGGAPLLFPGMPHDLMTAPAWVEPIDAIIDWLEKELSG